MLDACDVLEKHFKSPKLMDKEVVVSSFFHNMCLNISSSKSIKNFFYNYRLKIIY